MHLIWKRPDGFHSAVPQDFRTVSLSNGARLWLHGVERDWYPFQVSGDWEGQPQTVRLNRLVNLLEADDDAWRLALGAEAGNSPDTAHALVQWLESLKGWAKGNTWELEIILCALSDVQARLTAATVDAPGLKAGSD